MEKNIEIDFLVISKMMTVSTKRYYNLQLNRLL